MLRLLSRRAIPLRAAGMSGLRARRTRPLAWAPHTLRRLRGALPHPVGLGFQRGVVVDGGPVDLRGRLHAPLALLDHVPRLVGQMLVLTGREVDVGPLREGVRLHRGGRGGIAVDAHIRKRLPRKRLDPRLQIAGQPALRRRRRAGLLSLQAIGLHLQLVVIHRRALQRIGLALQHLLVFHALKRIGLALHQLLFLEALNRVGEGLQRFELRHRRAARGELLQRPGRPGPGPDRGPGRRGTARAIGCLASRHVETSTFPASKPAERYEIKNIHAATDGNVMPGKGWRAPGDMLGSRNLGGKAAVATRRKRQTGLRRGASACLLGGLLLAPGACGLVDAARTTNAAELVGLAIDAPCVVERNEVGDLGGAFLRQAGESARFDLFHVRGRPGATGLPRRLRFDDTAIRRLSATDDGGVTGGRASTAVPMDGMEGGPSSAFTLSYTAGDTRFSGPLTLGIIPAPSEIPTSGQAAFTGTAQMTVLLQAPDGGTRRLALTGDATLQVGYGSGQSLLRVGNVTGGDGALPFETLEWGPLGFCGARIVSTGAGTFRLLDDAGTRVRPFSAPPEADAQTPSRARLESTLHRGDGPATPPSGAGGVFAIQGDGGIVWGAFTVSGP